MKYDVIIGLEIHAELKTASKMFCRCHNNPLGKEPNTAVCPICLGHPGTLPVLNQEAVVMILKLGLALNGEINRISKFDRKNYFYPDLTKGYQISQYDLPLIYTAKLEVDNENIDITRLHLEEDTGKLTHPDKEDYTLIDYNRAGTPLIEMVTEPVIKDAISAKKFCQKYQQILRYLEISDADMEKGQMRCEANISLQAEGSWKYEDGQILPTGEAELNPKVEIKNINSFKSVEKAINFEIERQTELLEKGEKIAVETRGWSDTQNKTISQRKKESSADYRYFPEPDIPSFDLSALTENVQTTLPELPSKRRTRFVEEYGLKKEDARVLCEDKDWANYAEDTFSELASWLQDAQDCSEEQALEERRKLASLTANWMQNRLKGLMAEQAIDIRILKISPENFAEFITLVALHKVNQTTGMKLLSAMLETGDDPSHLLEEKKLGSMANAEILADVVERVVQSHPQEAERYRQGKKELLAFFIGLIMKETEGAADAATVRNLLLVKLET